MKIAQLSDPHLDIRTTNPYGVDVWDNFAWSLDAAMKHGCDLIVVTGDLAWRSATEDLYRRIDQLLRETEIEFLVLPGNHDDRTMFCRVFGRRYAHGADRPLDLSVHVGGLPMYVLDSGDGTILDGQLAWLDARLADHRAAFQRGERAAAFHLWIHHPVLLGFHRYMDANYALTNATAVLATITPYLDEVPIHVYCGHYHVDDERSQGNLVQRTCPALFVQIDPAADEFTVLSATPGFRLVEIDVAGIVASTVVYRRRDSA